MIIRSKAPLRLGLAGGGSDVSPYSDLYGGQILNATINLSAYCTIETQPGETVVVDAYDCDTTSSGAFTGASCRISAPCRAPSGSRRTMMRRPVPAWVRPPRWWCVSSSVSPNG